MNPFHTIGNSSNSSIGFDGIDVDVNFYGGGGDGIAIARAHASGDEDDSVMMDPDDILNDNNSLIDEIYNSAANDKDVDDMFMLVDDDDEDEDDDDDDDDGVVIVTDVIDSDDEDDVAPANTNVKNTNQVGGKANIVFDSSTSSFMSSTGRENSSSEDHPHATGGGLNNMYPAMTSASRSFMCGDQRRPHQLQQHQQPPRPFGHGNRENGGLRRERKPVFLESKRSSERDHHRRTPVSMNYCSSSGAMKASPASVSPPIPKEVVCVSSASPPERSYSCADMYGNNGNNSCASSPSPVSFDHQSHTMQQERDFFGVREGRFDNNRVRSPPKSSYSDFHARPGGAIGQLYQLQQQHQQQQQQQQQRPVQAFEEARSPPKSSYSDYHGNGMRQMGMGMMQQQQVQQHQNRHELRTERENFGSPQDQNRRRSPPKSSYSDYQVRQSESQQQQQQGGQVDLDAQYQDTLRKLAKSMRLSEVTRAEIRRLNIGSSVSCRADAGRSSRSGGSANNHNSNNDLRLMANTKSFDSAASSNAGAVSAISDEVYTGPRHQQMDESRRKLFRYVSHYN